MILSHSQYKPWHWTWHPARCWRPWSLCESLQACNDHVSVPDLCHDTVLSQWICLRKPPYRFSWYVLYNVTMLRSGNKTRYGILYNRYQNNKSGENCEAQSICGTGRCKSSKQKRGHYRAASSAILSRRCQESPDPCEGPAFAYKLSKDGHDSLLSTHIEVTLQSTVA